ncbi:MAG TPA: histidine kinase, partial [Gemmatimonas sp.]|nr:histidine kinase [Gemmatimonas sp.]
MTRFLFAAFWLIPSILAAIRVAFVGDPDGDPYGLGVALVWQGAIWLVWSLWSQLILSLVGLVPLGAGRTTRWFAIHLLTMAVVCAVNSVAAAWLDHVFAANHDAPFALDLRLALFNNLDFQVVLYWAVVGAAYMVEFVRRYQERDRAAAELEQKLARTQLDALRMQLNPHFLFNALNSVAELMEMDVREAQRTLTRVSDLLRLSLRSAASAVIPLWQEIELVELYLQIARVRYGHGLDVDIDVESSAVDIDVPSFLLQPLVENALKHGL